MVRRDFLSASAAGALGWLATSQNTSAAPKNKDVDACVERGLEYLRKNQGQDGHWEAPGGNYPTTVTAIAGMAMLCSGVPTAPAAVVVSVDMDIATPGIQSTRTAAINDIFTIAGDSQTYVVTADITLAVGNTTVAIAPALRKATAGAEAVTLKASHRVNLAFHRDAIAFASRPFADRTEGLGNMIQAASDPVSGVSLRLEVSREHKRTRFSYDMLYGATLIRPEFATRLAG